MTFKLKKIIQIKIFRPLVLPILITLGVIFPIIYLIHIPLLWEIIIVTLLYFPLITIASGFSKNEIYFLKRALT
jgi:hypothetical protein